MPHYTTWGGTYVTRSVAREDRSPIQSDGDFNDVVFHHKQADSFMKLDDIRGEFQTTDLRSDNRFVIEPINLVQGLDTGGVNYAEAVGLDSSIFDVANNLIGSADPGGDDV